MTKRKSKDQNVGRICHPQKAVKIGGSLGEEGTPVTVDSWKPPTNVGLEA